MQVYHGNAPRGSPPPLRDARHGRDGGLEGLEADARRPAGREGALPCSPQGPPRPPRRPSGAERPEGPRNVTWTWQWRSRGPDRPAGTPQIPQEDGRARARGGRGGAFPLRNRRGARKVNAFQTVSSPSPLLRVRKFVLTGRRHATPPSTHRAPPPHTDATFNRSACLRKKNRSLGRGPKPEPRDQRTLGAPWAHLPTPGGTGRSVERHGLCKSVTVQGEAAPERGGGRCGGSWWRGRVG